MTTTPAMPELPEPEAYIFQHEETGNTMFVDRQQVEWGFEKNNPRLQKVGKAYTADQMRAYALATLQAQPAEVSDEEIERVARSHGTGGWQTLPDMIRFARTALALRPQAVPMTEDTELLEFMFQHRAVVSLEFEGGWDAELLDESGSTVSAASGSTPRDALRRLKAHHGITAPAGGEKQA